MVTKEFAVLFGSFWLVLAPCLGYCDAKRALNTVANLERIRTVSPACEGKITIIENDEKQIEIVFNDLVVKRGDKKPFIRCRLLGELIIPKHHTIQRDSYARALVRGAFDQIGDQAGARLSISIGSVRETTITLVKNAEIENGHVIDVETLLPAVTAESEDRTLIVGIFFEGMINYQLNRQSTVSVALDKIILPPIELNVIGDPPTSVLNTAGDLSYGSEHNQ